MRNDVSRNKHWLRDLLAACWQVLNFCRRVVVNIGFIFLLVILVLIFSANQSTPVVIERNSILTLNLVGDVVEQKTFVDPYDEVISEMAGNRSQNPEIRLVDVLDVISEASTDPKIKALVLNLHSLRDTGLNKLQEIGHAITQFKQSGKTVVAYGDYYSQSQYYLAAHADETYLHPMGAIGLDGFGRYRMYYKSALEKLNINAHVFRVGTFKSAVEPFIRDDMSDAAKQANEQWLGDLWQMYKQDIAAVRDIEVADFDETIDGFLQKLRETKGSFADLAVTHKWVDGLKNHQEFDQYLKSKFGKEPKYVNFHQYLASLQEIPLDADEGVVGVVVAKGTIYDGKRKAGEIGGQSTSALLKQARLDKSVKAVVLRIDSPGGSAFASELIRNEVEALKSAGKPVVVSMSTLAASGGYWIASSANEIWAAESTITGSIGIFGMFLTFEDTLKSIGVHTDGVATTQFNGLSTVRPLDPKMAEVIQLAIEHGYDQFISLVANERNITKEEVDKIAQGRVWSGKTAKELGLVDQLGFYDDALDSAASLANLDNYRVKTIETPLDPMDQFIQELFKTYYPQDVTQFDLRRRSLLSITEQLTHEAQKWTEMNDPHGVYIYCLACDNVQM